MAKELAIFSSDFTITASVTAGVESAGEGCGERVRSSPVLITEVSMWKVAFWG